MAAMSDFLEAELLDHVLNNDSYTSPTIVYLALYTTATTDAGGGSEVPNLYSYARYAVDSSTSNKWTVSSPGGTATNNADFAFPAASGGNWGVVEWVAITTSATYGGGSFLLHGQLTAPRTINDGDTFEFASGDFVVTFA